MRKLAQITLICTLALAFPTGSTLAQSGGPSNGTLVLTGGDFGLGVLERFVEAAGGEGASVLYIPSASSGIRLPNGFIWIPPELPGATNNRTEFEEELSELFHADVTVLHSRDRSVWDSERFAESIRATQAVWIGGGNAGRLAGFVLDTRSHGELVALLERGGVIGGQSAGAIIAGSFTIRGIPGKPALMARGHTRGFGFMRNVAINPHLTEADREDELVTIVDAHPEILGIGIDERAAIVVKGDQFEVIGHGRIAIYDNKQHDSGWYYYLDPGSAFDLQARAVRDAER